MPKLYLIIGIPGSGKSTAAQQIIDKNPDTVCYEADMFFIRNGKYVFNPKLLFAAHNWCKKKTEEAIEVGLNVIVSNTSLTPKERKPYLDLIKKYNYDYEVIYCNGNYNNIHGVPQEKLEIMKKKYIPFNESEFNQ